MNADLKNQLQSLRITAGQRPGEGRRAAGGSWFGGMIRGAILLAVGAAGFWAWQQFGDRIGLPVAGDGPLAAFESPAEITRFIVAPQAPPRPGAVLTATGKIVSDHLVQVVTKVSGQIIAMHFEQGDRVEAGQLLARIEDVNYRARRDQAAALVTRTEASLAFARTNFERIARLRTRDDSAVIELAEAQRDLDEWTAQLAAERAALEFAQKQLDDTAVVAPISGVILERNVEVGDFVAAEGGRGANANAQFASIADMSKLRVEVDINELDVARIQRGMFAIITPDAYKDRRYEGHVLWIDPGANYAKATVQAKVRIEQPDEYLRVEGAAQVQIFAERPDNNHASTPSASGPTAGDGASQSAAGASQSDDGASQSADAASRSDTRATSPASRDTQLWIPGGALLPMSEDTGARVYRVIDQRLRATAIVVGRREGVMVEVLSGLAAGDVIVVGNLEKLRDGQRVR